MVEALRVNRTRILIRRQLITPAVDHERFFELRQQHESTDRGFRRRCQQSVIAASVQTNDRRRRKTADTVRLEPFSERGTTEARRHRAEESGTELAQTVPVKRNHDL